MALTFNSALPKLYLNSKRECVISMFGFKGIQMQVATPVPELHLPVVYTPSFYFVGIINASLLWTEVITVQWQKVEAESMPMSS